MWPMGLLLLLVWLKLVPKFWRGCYEFGSQVCGFVKSLLEIWQMNLTELFTIWRLSRLEKGITLQLNIPLHKDVLCYA